MKGFLKFIFLMITIALLSAFLAPILFDFLPFKFERIFNRLIMIFTLTAVVWAVCTKRLQFPGETLAWKGFGLKGFLSAFAAGFLTLIAISLVKTGFGIVTWSISLNDPVAWAERLGMSFIAAIVIGIIEELFFRGFIFTTLQKKFAWPILPSILVTNIFYALIHYTKGKKIFIGGDPGFRDGLKLVWAPFQNLSDWTQILPGAIGLFIFGVILTMLFLRTQSLYPCIGLHAGCVYFLKLDGVFIRHVDREPLWLFGTGQNYDGFIGWMALFLLGFFLLRFYAKTLKSGSFAAGFLILASCMGVMNGNLYAADKEWVTFSPDQETENTDKNDWQSSRTLSPLSPVNDSFDGDFSSTPPSKPAVVKNPETTVSIQPGQNAVKLPSPEEFLKREEKTKVDVIPVEVKKLESSKRMPVIPDEFPQERETVSLPIVIPDEKQSQELEKANSFESVSSLAEEVSRAENSAAIFPKENFDEKETPKSFEQEIFPQPNQLQVAPKAEPIQQPKKRKKSQESGYVFTDAVESAEVSWISDFGDIFYGQWNGEKLIFPDSQSPLEIQVREQISEEGFEKDGFSFQPSPEGLFRLRFNEVTPAAKIRLRYGFERNDNSSVPKASVYIRVWAGKHALKRIRLFNETGWREEVINLGPAAFLKTPLVVTFEITSDEPLDRNFNLYARAE